MRLRKVNSTAIYLALMLAIVLVVSSLVRPIEAAPVWITRLSLGTFPGDLATGIDADTDAIYVVFQFRDTGRGTVNSSLAVLNPVDGAITNAVSYIMREASLYAESLIAYGINYVYIAGYYVFLSNNSRGAFILYVDKQDIASILNWVLLYDREGGNFSVVPGGLCVDGAGNVYLVGSYQNLSKKYEMFILRANTDLSNPNTVLYYNLYYELIGIACTMGPDGYLYVTAQLVDNISGQYFPLYLVIYKIDPSTMQIVDIYATRLYNSQGYVNLHSLYDAAIASDTAYLYVAFGYTDEKPSPTSPTTGAAVIKLDVELNKLWRLNISSDYYEELDTIVASVNGDVIVGGQTTNDYGTGLGTSYYKSFTVIMDSSGSIISASIYGASDADSEIEDLALDANGYIYSAAGHFSDYFSYYDVTTAVKNSASVGSIYISPLTNTLHLHEAEKKAVHQVASLPHKPPILIAKKTVRHAPGPAVRTATKSTSGDRIEAEHLQIVPSRSAPGKSPALTPSGDSSALVLRYSEQASPPPTPPQPIPEPTVLVSLTALLATFCCIARVVKKSYITG